MDEIDHLKQKWIELDRAYRHGNKIQEMLEELEFYLSAAEEDFRTHPNDEKKAIYEQLLMKKRELDSLLDEVEGITEEQVKEARDVLLARVLKTRPELIEAYGLLHHEWMQKLNQENGLQKLLIGLDRIRHHLQLLVAIREKVRGFGMLRFLLGQNPTKAISSEIEQITSLAEAIIKLKEEHEDVTLLLRQLISLGKKNWNYGVIDKHYKPLCDSVIRAHEQYSHQLRLAHIESIRAADALARWIEQI